MTEQAKSFEKTKSLARLFRRFRRETTGGLLPLIAGSLTALVGFTGLAVDGARLYYAKDVLQKSLDAAGLAAGHAQDLDDMSNDAEEFFQANFLAAGSYIKDAAFEIDISDDNTQINLTATATVEATFMQLFGYTDLALSATTEITRETRGMELTLVMDNTGSMRSGGKIDAMKQAARDLIEIVYGDEDVNPNLYVSLVPYTATVNVGPAHTGWLTPASQAEVGDATRYADGAITWKGCMMARDFGEDQTDNAPSADFTAYYWEDSRDNNWIDDDGNFDIDESNGAKNDGTGPNLGCGPAITPLTASKTTINAAIDEMLPWHRGGTTSSLGLAWGWRTLSPTWRGHWVGGDRPNELPLDHELRFMDKVVVVLTDGQNQLYDWPGDGNGPDGSDFTAYGREGELEDIAGQSALNEINDRFANTCASMKDDDIIIYSITFGGTPNATTQSLFRNCASNPAFYFHAPSNSDLSEAFEAIGRQLSNLRLSR